MNCSRSFGTLNSGPGIICYECRHPAIVHPGDANPDARVCLLCYLNDFTSFIDEARHPKIMLRISTQDKYEELLASIWLYVDWHYVTKQLTTEQKDLWADAIEASSAREHPDSPTRAERWWRDDSPIS